MTEKKNVFPGFVGPSYSSRSTVFNNQRSVNLYLESDKTTGTSKENQLAYLIGTPGLRTVTQMELGEIRCMYVPRSNENFMYVISGNKLYVTTDAETYTECTGNLITTQGTVKMADNGDDLMFVDGYTIYTCPVGGNVVTKTVSLNAYPATSIDYQDGYFLLNHKDTQYFFWSDLYATTFPPLNTAAKAGESDKLVAIVSNNKQIYLFGRNSIETWANTAYSINTPFSWQPGRFISYGCTSADSVVQNEGTVYWLGRSQQGEGIVYVLSSEQSQRISTTAVEHAIQSSGGDLSTASAYGYQEEGHYFYVLNIEGLDSTWVYDSLEGQWHERQSFAQKAVPVVTLGNYSPTLIQSTSVKPNDTTLSFHTALTPGNMMVVTALSDYADPSGAFDASWEKQDVSFSDWSIFVYYRLVTGADDFNITGQFSDLAIVAHEVEGLSDDLTDLIVLPAETTTYGGTSPRDVVNTTTVDDSVLGVLACVVDYDSYDGSAELLDENIQMDTTNNLYLACGFGTGNGKTITVTLNQGN